jgi:hypothetical protein
MGIENIENLTNTSQPKRADTGGDVEEVLDEEQLRRKAARDDSDRVRDEFRADSNVNGKLNTYDDTRGGNNT